MQVSLYRRLMILDEKKEINNEADRSNGAMAMMGDDEDGEKDLTAAGPAASAVQRKQSQKGKVCNFGKKKKKKELVT